MSKCEHNKRKSNCKECGGSAYCEHNKQKRRCKECGGSDICDHDKRKARCKQCGGSEICVHNIMKQCCIKCSPEKFCIHNRYVNRCRDCDAGLCEHNRNIYACKDCGGTMFCEHNKQKNLCRECSPQNFCIHNRNKHNCRDCGTGLCEHNRMRNACKDCGTAYCQHNKWKSHCFECGGGSICVHNKRKTRCKECGGSELCKSDHCETKGNSKYNGYCLPCCIQVCPDIEVSRNYKTKEKDVVDRIKEFFPNFTWIADKKIKDGCSLRRPDLLLDMGTHIIIVEVDENQHSDYDCSCEHKRLMEISQDVGHRPIVFIRFNPDAYINQDGILIKSCWKLNKLGIMTIGKNKKKEWEERISTLTQQIQYWIDTPNEKMVEIIELFY